MPPNAVVPQSIVARLHHLTRSECTSVAVPELLPTIGGHTATFDFISPTVLYPVEGRDGRYLVVVCSKAGQRTLIGVDYLAHASGCEDPGCQAVRAEQAERRRAIPPHGMLFARLAVDPGVDWLPRQIPYLIHIDDYPQFTNGPLPAAGYVDLF